MIFAGVTPSVKSAACGSGTNAGSTRGIVAPAKARSSMVSTSSATRRSWMPTITAIFAVATSPTCITIGSSNVIRAGGAPCDTSSDAALWRLGSANNVTAALGTAGAAATVMPNPSDVWVNNRRRLTNGPTTPKTTPNPRQPLLCERSRGRSTHMVRLVVVRRREAFGSSRRHIRRPACGDNITCKLVSQWFREYATALERPNAGSTLRA